MQCNVVLMTMDKGANTLNNFCSYTKHEYHGRDTHVQLMTAFSVPQQLVSGDQIATSECVTYWMQLHMS